jgi:serine protease Do
MQIHSSNRGRFEWRPLGVAGIVAGALVMSGVVPQLTATGPAKPVAVVSSPVASPAAATSYADAVNRAAPAVVTVRIERKAAVTPSVFEDDPFFQRFFGGGGQGRNAPVPIERGLGSGVIVSDDGNILTNNHVVESADHVTVTLADGREYTAKVVGTDPATDLAVVRIDAKNLPTLPLGDSDHLRVGDVVLAIGNPLGVGETVTMGIISAKGRTTDVGNGNYEDFLQTDAAINQGNSGGALVTASGELVGINSQIKSSTGGSIGIGFAIPSAMAKNVMTQLVATGHVRRAILGVTVQPVTSDIAKSMGLSTVRGALVDSVEPGGPAAKAGLMPGDIILKVDGSVVDDSNQLRNRVSSMAPGSTAVVDFERHGAQRQVTVTLGELPDATRQTGGQSTGKEALGMTLEALTPSLAQAFRLPRTADGVAVTNVDPSGAAARAGLRAGDVVREIDGRAVKTPTELRDALARHADGPALAYVQRGDARFYVPLSGHSS